MRPRTRIDSAELIGQNFGEFKVISIKSVERYSERFNCQCVLCGGPKVLTYYELFSQPKHAAKMCSAKVYKREPKQKKKDYTKIPGCKKNCRYWRRLEPSHSQMCCHYNLDVGERRPRDGDGNCIGYDPSEYVRAPISIVFRNGR